MIKIIELIIVATLLIFSFFAGVKYSDSVRNHASWLFEPKEEEIELPDLSNENLQEMGAPMDENGDNIESPASAEGASAPLEPAATTEPKPIAPAAAR
jgi:hypothetical protein